MTPTTKTPDEILKNHDAKCRPRARIEYAIALRTIRDLSAAGYRLKDAEDDFTADNEDEWLAHLFNLDEARLTVARPTGPMSFILLVFGNDGYELIADYGVNIEHVIAPINDWSDEAQEAGIVPILPTEEKEAGATIPELMRLFPTLSSYAGRAEKEAWSPREMLNQILAGQVGGGATYAAHYIAGALDAEILPFPIAKALERWDSEHRKAYAEASRRLALM